MLLSLAFAVHIGQKINYIGHILSVDIFYSKKLKLIWEMSHIPHTPNKLNIQQSLLEK